ncbi:hypothetical protein ACPF7Z_16845 [Halomonas sp. GXIMD04776]|uniref:hypothetical protein n=1 Tax=Halomonas sp. GXIMD04776 TaxID=3415605 RepID=UPI003CABBDE1
MTSIARSIIAVLVFATSSFAVAESDNPDQQRYPDVVGVEAMSSGENRFDFDVTVSSPYDSTKRYADAFRVMSDDGDVYGVRELLHDHADEQPFTRRLSGVDIPPEVRGVIVQARDQVHGYGGETMRVELPRR